MQACGFHIIQALREMNRVDRLGHHHRERSSLAHDRQCQMLSRRIARA